MTYRRLSSVYQHIIKHVPYSNKKAKQPDCQFKLSHFEHFATIMVQATSPPWTRRVSAVAPIKLAIFHQALPPPAINGVTKPAKPGGYKDSGSDIGYVLSNDPNIEIVTPVVKPDPSSQDDWTFPETAEGIHEALDRGATHLWANIHTHAEHPLQTLDSLNKYEDTVMVVGQPPRLADYADDKAWFNEYLRRRADELDLSLPKAFIINSTKGRIDEQLDRAAEYVGLPAVGKPPRGRGSSGVKLCSTVSDLREHVGSLLKDSERVIVEEYLAGEEGSIAVLPPVPSDAQHRYTAQPYVQRFDQTDGIMVYSGTTPVSVNSRAKTLQEIADNHAYRDTMRQCEAVAGILRATACVRIDVRRGIGGRFRVFDVNLKPNYNGPGRPGRDDQLNLMAMGMEQLGWNYERFLHECLDRARPLGDLRARGGHFDEVFRE